MTPVPEARRRRGPHPTGRVSRPDAPTLHDGVLGIVRLVAALAVIATVLVGAATTGSSQGGPRCRGQEPTIVASPGVPTVGTDGDDVIVGTIGPDIIDAGDGDDLVCARSGDDEIDGGAGDDVIRGGLGGDRIVGGAGRDEIRGGRGADLVWGGAGVDRVIGGPGRDEVWSGAADDVVRGGGGRDVVRGGLGDDVISGGKGDDGLSGSAGNDRVLGSAGDDVLSGVGGADVLRGGPGSDACAGGPGRDRIRGCEEPAPPGQRPRVVAIGDSVMRGAGKTFCGELERAVPGIVEDSVIGRSFGSARAIVERFMARTDRETVFVIGLGTNGPISADAVVDLLAVDERAEFVFVTISAPKSWETEINAIYARAVEANRDRAALADWHAVASSDPTLTVPDEIHLTCRGAAAYADVIAESLVPLR